MSAHVTLKPSFAPVWGWCSAAPIAAMEHPGGETAASRHGVGAHALAKAMLLNFKNGGGDAMPTMPRDVVIDEEMEEGAEVYVDDILNTVRGLGAGVRYELLIEQRVKMPAIHPSNQGPLDCALITYDRHDRIATITLWDYKSGHTETPAEGNLQLINYAQGLIDMYGIRGNQAESIAIVLKVVQPFCYRGSGPVVSWTGRLSDLRGYFNLLESKAREAFSNPRFTSGPHCKKCPAILFCAASKAATYNLIDVVDAPYEMDKMGGSELATERSIIKRGLVLATARLKAIEDDLMHRIQAGKPVKGLTVETGQGSMGWSLDVGAVVALGATFGADFSKPGAKTPLQAKKCLTTEQKAMFEIVLPQVTKRPPGKLKLVESKNSYIAKAFKKSGE